MCASASRYAYLILINISGILFHTENKIYCNTPIIYEPLVYALQLYFQVFPWFLRQHDMYFSALSSVKESMTTKWNWNFGMVLS